MKLDEASRLQLINKSKSAKIVKSYGTTRYDRRHMQHIAKSTASFDDIDFNALFRANVLSFNILIKGETDTYTAKVLFNNALNDIKSWIKRNNDILDYKAVYRALVDAVNKLDIYVSCSCPDWKYRLSYQATKQGYNSGAAELRPAKITNPDDSAGAGCKHIMTLLGNLDWVLKLSASVYNYIRYIQSNYEDKFLSIIYPALYDAPYEDFEEPDEVDAYVEPDASQLTPDELIKAQLEPDEAAAEEPEEPEEENG